MWTTRIIQTSIGNEQIIQNLASKDRLVHDPGDIFHTYPAVPDPLGINYHGRPVLALLEAAGVIGTGERSEASPLELFLECLAQCLPSSRVATTPLVAGFPNIPADKDVISKRRHRLTHSYFGISRWSLLARRRVAIGAAGRQRRCRHPAMEGGPFTMTTDQQTELLPFSRLASRHGTGAPESR